MLREIAKKLLIQAFDKNLDLAVATEATPHIKRDQFRIACLNYLLRKHDYFFFQTSAAE